MKGRAFKASSPEEYSQIAKKNDDLQDNDSANIKNDELNEKRSNNIFPEEEKNKLIYSCYFCNFESDIHQQYKEHCLVNHSGKIAFPSDADIEKINRLLHNKNHRDK